MVYRCCDRTLYNGTHKTATKNQGRSGIDKISREPGYRICGITRNSCGAKAESLEARGAEIAKGDRPTGTRPLRSWQHSKMRISSSPSATSGAGQPLIVCVAHYEIQQLKDATNAAAKVQTLE